MSATNFQPVPGPGARQIGYAVLLGEAVPESKWNSLTFSDAFQARYGIPVQFWSHWNKLMSISCRTELAPHFQRTIYEVLKDMNFLRFCHAVDYKANQRGMRVPGRLEMEAMYAQFLVHKYDELEASDDMMKWILKKALAKRLNANAEKYWAEKPSKFGLADLDVTCLNEEADEPEGESCLDFNDDHRVEEEYGEREGDADDEREESRGETEGTQLLDEVEEDWEVEDMVIEGLGDIDDVTMEGTERSFGPLAYRIR